MHAYDCTQVRLAQVAQAPWSLRQSEEGGSGDDEGDCDDSELAALLAPPGSEQVGAGADAVGGALRRVGGLAAVPEEWEEVGGGGLAPDSGSAPCPDGPPGAGTSAAASALPAATTAGPTSATTPVLGPEASSGTALGAPCHTDPAHPSFYDLTARVDQVAGSLSGWRFNVYVTDLGPPGSTVGLRTRVAHVTTADADKYLLVPLHGPHLAAPAPSSGTSAQAAPKQKHTRVLHVAELLPWVATPTALHRHWVRVEGYALVPVAAKVLDACAFMAGPEDDVPQPPDLRTITVVDYKPPAAGAAADSGAAKPGSRRSSATGVTGAGGVRDRRSSTGCGLGGRLSGPGASAAVARRLSGMGEGDPADPASPAATLARLTGSSAAGALHKAGVTAPVPPLPPVSLSGTGEGAGHGAGVAGGGRTSLMGALAGRGSGSGAALVGGALAARRASGTGGR